MADQLTLPSVPVKHSEFLKYISSQTDKPVVDLVQPYREFDAAARKIYAQAPNHPAVADNLLNLVPLFDSDGATDIRIRARDLASESEEIKSKYLMPLKDEQRKGNGSPALVPTLRQFQTNFSVFCETSLNDLDWSNVIAAGSAVTTSLVPVPDSYADSKRGIRKYYHEDFAPASDVDLFLYGLTEEQAMEKIKQIERCIKDSILTETSTIRTKHAITIVSQYPTRHVQIVLRLYKSIAEILTGFDVDCSCAAYDGNQVYLTPRAIGAFMTQINHIDLTRRSPSYENRLSKYSHRGFEVFWPDLDRSRIDPTIFERSFTRTLGLARLLVLEKLPKASDRDRYLEQRRTERGRPPSNIHRHDKKLRGNIKNDWSDEVAEWVEEEDVSNYHTFTIPYGARFHARKIEKLLYTRDLLLNAEWNAPDDREVNLHRHPAFFGSAEDVMQDCCGYCPQPTTLEEKEIAEAEGKIYISGSIKFLKDNPGRQEIGSFNPITDADWTEMAYIGNTAGLCEAIVDCDIEEVKRWLGQGIDVNRRDHTGRTPLQLAVMSSSAEIVQVLVDHGARLISRLVDGRTALHLAAARGSVDIVKILLTKSEENEEEASRKELARRNRPENQITDKDSDLGDDVEVISHSSDDDGPDDQSYATGSFVKVKKDGAQESAMPDDANDLDPDIYDVNVIAWDSKASPLHLAILKGHVDIVQELVTSFGADVLLPIKLFHDWDNSPRDSILSLALALRLPEQRCKVMTAKLLEVGASPAQGDYKGLTALDYVAKSQYDLLPIYLEHDRTAVERAIKHYSSLGDRVRSVLISAITARNTKMAMQLLELGAPAFTSFEDFVACVAMGHEVLRAKSTEQNLRNFRLNVRQPIFEAVDQEMPSIAIELLHRGADPNTILQQGYSVLEGTWNSKNIAGMTLLDLVQTKLTSLRQYQGERVKHLKPYPLDPDDLTYLQGIPDGSYQMWATKLLLDTERDAFNKKLKEYRKATEEEPNIEGLAEKKFAIKELIDGFEKLETSLLSRGAKKFQEMHPGKGSLREEQSKPGDVKTEEQPFRIILSFRAYDLTKGKREDYIQLFEAAWNGDVETIKALTLGMWGPDQQYPPLEIGIADSRGFSPFTLALLRGHLDAAKVILAIATVQFKPNDQQRVQYHMQDYERDSCSSDNDSDSDNDSIRVESRLVDPKFTFDNIGEVKYQVESRISPWSILEGSGDFNLFLDKEQRADTSLDNPFAYAIWRNDVQLLDFLISLKQELATKYPNVDQRDSFGDAQFRMAMRLGRLRCLETLIKRTGVGLPLDKLVEKSGIADKEKPKYYQGLSVHGKKRADWAAAGGGIRLVSPEDKSPPLLLAAREGNLEAVEWFLGTAPGRHYIQFAKANKNDSRLKRLSSADGGIERSILEWLNSSRDLVLHCAVISKCTEGSKRLIQYLVDHMPHCLEARSADGLTPLSLAFYLHRVEFVKILINYGANQTVRDKEGRNILHGLLTSACQMDKIDSTQALLRLIDPLLGPSLLSERCSIPPGSLTPLGLFIQLRCQKRGAYNINQWKKLLHLILDFADSSNQKHLELFDGSGNSPLHRLVKSRDSEMLKILTERRPDLLCLENTIGVTPAELAESIWLTEATNNPPQDTKPWRGNRAYYDPVSLVATAVVQPPAHFKRNSGAESLEGDSTARGIYQFCCMQNERATAGTYKRKLVSLLDANEVAKRLSGDANAPKSTLHREKKRKTDDEISKWGLSQYHWH